MPYRHHKTYNLYLHNQTPTSTSLLEKLSVSAVQNIWHILCDPKNHRCVCTRPPQDPSISQISLVHTLPSYFIHRFNINLHSNSPLPKQCFLFKCFGKNFECIVSSPPSMLRVRSISSALILVPQYSAYLVGGKHRGAIFLISDLILLS